MFSIVTAGNGSFLILNGIMGTGNLLFQLISVIDTYSRSIIDQVGTEHIAIHLEQKIEFVGTYM